MKKFLYKFLIVVLAFGMLTPTWLTKVWTPTKAMAASDESVSNLTELQTALANTDITTINITANISAIPATLVVPVGHPVIINGGSHTLTFIGLESVIGSVDDGFMIQDLTTINDLTVDAGLVTPTAWVGTYAIQVYHTTATLNNVTATHANGGIIINNSTATLTGAINVSGNGFGGIESSGASASLNVSGSSWTNALESYGKPTIWEDGITGTTVINFGAFTRMIKGGQYQYYLAAGNSVAPDTTAPSVVLTSSTPNPTNGLIFVVAQFSEPVTGFLQGDIVVGNGAIDTFVAVDGDTYNFNINPTDGASVAVTIDVPAATSVDGAGNANTASNQITRTSDTVAPTGTISINSDAISTNNANVTLTLFSADAVQMEFNNGGVYSGLEDYATTKLWTLSSGDGIKNVRVKFVDAAGNETATGIPDTIILDTTAPTVTSVSSIINGATVYATGTSLKFNSATAPNPHTITVTFSENISNTPTIAVSGTPQTVTDCGDADAKTFCFAYAIPAATEYTIKTVQISGAQDVVASTMLADNSHTFVVDTVVPLITVSGLLPGYILPTINIANAASYTLNGTYTELGSMGWFAWYAFKVLPGPVLAAIGSTATESTTTIGASLPWSHTWTNFSTALAGLEGTFRIWSDVYDTAGNRGYLSNDGVYDLVAPTTPVINTVATDDIINAAERTATVTVTGTNESGSTVTLNGFATVVDTATTWHYVLTTGVIDAFDQEPETLIAIATDTAGNPSANGTRGITVDTTPPVIALHEKITVEATSPAGAVVNYTTPLATDNMDAMADAICSPASGSIFPIGITTVTCNKTDAAGNVAVTTNFDIKVRNVVAEDFGVMQISEVNGYTVGFGLQSLTAQDVTSVKIELFKDLTLLSTSDALVTLPNWLALGPVTSLSAPFNIDGKFDYTLDGYWSNTGWNGTLLDIPTKAVITVIDEVGNTYVAENTNPTGDPSLLLPSDVNQNPTIISAFQSADKTISVNFSGAGSGATDYIIYINGSPVATISNIGILGNDMGNLYHYDVNVSTYQSYTVQILAFDYGYQVGESSIINADVKASQTSSDNVIKASAQVVKTVATIAPQPVTPQAAASPTPTVTAPTTPAPTEQGQIKGTETTNNQESEKINWTPWIILFILIILAGAATGGYFYWFGRDNEEEIVSAEVIEKNKKLAAKNESGKSAKAAPKKNKRW